MIRSNVFIVFWWVKSFGGEVSSPGMVILRSVQTRRTSMAQSIVESVYITSVKVTITFFDRELRPRALHPPSALVRTNQCKRNYTRTYVDVDTRKVKMAIKKMIRRRCIRLNWETFTPDNSFRQERKHVKVSGFSQLQTSCLDFRGVQGHRQREEGAAERKYVSPS